MKKSVYLVIALIPFLLLGCTEKKTPPNIIFLLTDDQRWDAMGCAGNPSDDYTKYLES